MGDRSVRQLVARNGSADPLQDRRHGRRAVPPRDIPMPALPDWVARRVRPQALSAERDPDPTEIVAIGPPGGPPGQDEPLRRLLGRRR